MKKADSMPFSSVMRRWDPAHAKSFETRKLLMRRACRAGQQQRRDLQLLRERWPKCLAGQQRSRSQVGKRRSSTNCQSCEQFGASPSAHPESYNSWTPPNIVNGSTSPVTVIVITGRILAGTYRIRPATTRAADVCQRRSRKMVMLTAFPNDLRRVAHREFAP